MKCKHLKDGICEKLSDSEVKQPCIEGPCEFDTRNISELKPVYNDMTDTLFYHAENTRTASPRFTAEEREAMDRVVYHAEADLENRWTKSCQIYKEDTTAIAVVRKMLEGSV